jgi:hypothetical protein
MDFVLAAGAVVLGGGESLIGDGTAILAGVRVSISTLNAAAG